VPRLVTADVDRRDVIMYVNSLKLLHVLPPDARDDAISSMSEHGHYTFTAPGGWAGTHGGYIGSTLFDTGRYGGKPITGEELTEEEKDAIGRVLRLVHEHGRKLHLVDIGKETSFHRYIEVHLHHLRDFPVLVRPDGRRLEGITQFTKDKLAAFLND
jgi:hypothetical protein